MNMVGCKAWLDCTLMAPHLIPAEQDQLLKWKGEGFMPVRIHAKLASARERRQVEVPDLTSIRKFPRQTYGGRFEVRFLHSF